MLLKIKAGPEIHLWLVTRGFVYQYDSHHYLKSPKHYVSHGIEIGLNGQNEYVNEYMLEFSTSIVNTPFYAEMCLRYEVKTMRLVCPK